MRSRTKAGAGLLAQAAVDVASAGGDGDAAASAARAVAKDLFQGLPDVVINVARVEGSWHESHAPVARISKTGKMRRGAGVQMEYHQQQEDSSDEDVDSLAGRTSSREGSQNEKGC
jgi:hypothetical protein